MDAIKKRYDFIVNSLRTAVAACVAMLLVACTGNFEDYNTDPYNPTLKDGATSLTPTAQIGGLLETMLFQMHHHQENDSQMIDQMVGDQYGGYLVTPTMWQGTNFSTYNQSEGWSQIPFNTPFEKFYANWHKIKDITGGEGFIFAWANVIRVATMLRVTDTYGPIPYSKMGFGQFNVAYDKEEDVYKHMIEDLNAGIAQISTFWGTNRGKDIPIAAYDLLYRGDFGKWVLFANSLKLRLAMRLSNVAPDYAKSIAEAAVAAGVIVSNADNALLPATDNPYFKASDSWGDLRLGADIDSYMNGYGDPRLPYYATPFNNTPGTYRGVRMGVNVSSESKSQYATYSMPDFRQNSPMLVMNAAEVAFLRAEGALRNWNMGGGSAQSFYEQGIRRSMEQYTVPVTTVEAYINNGSSIPASYSGHDPATNIAAASTITIRWNDGDAFEKKLERIITQKWLANFTLGFESWSERRRTGYPKLFPTVNNKSNGVVSDSRGARRLKFPLSEYSRNSANVQAAIQMIGGTDSPAVDLWWAKKN